MESCSLKSEVALTNSCHDNSFLNNNSLIKTKSEKSKDNKLLISENISNDVKNSKCQIKTSKINKDEDELNIQEKENIEEKQKSDNVKNDIKEKETSPSNDASKKYNTKEVKEKKNKADTRHRSRKHKNDTKEVKENVTPLIRNKQQLPIQVYTVMHLLF